MMLRLFLFDRLCSDQNPDIQSKVSATLLGEPDLGLLTPPEMARKAGQICYSVPNIPVLVDADTGKPMHPMDSDIVLKCCPSARACGIAPALFGCVCS
jgi:2-methylisocitrate lyase-like PEP mutase family enzyme